jgi:N12 class adenine-specific DNA methylase
VKDIARGILTLRARLQKRLNQNAKDAPVTFEELGVDGLLIDEAHLYKNLYFSTAMNGIAGLKGSDSDRAMDMFLKVRQINSNRRAATSSSRPARRSNTLSELYTMFRYLAQPRSIGWA